MSQYIVLNQLNSIGVPCTNLTIVQNGVEFDYQIQYGSVINALQILSHMQSTFSQIN
jgi:hypothetical protein